MNRLGAGATVLCLLAAAAFAQDIYGRSFRNPSPFEPYYGEGVSQIPKPAVDSERLQTFEVALERQVGKKIELQANAYHYRLGDLIQSALVNGPMQQYRNLPGDMELQFGIHNLFNYRYWDPAGKVQETDRIQQDGRSFFARLSWASRPKIDVAPRTIFAGPPRKEL